MGYWRYRAYDGDLQVRTGVVQNDSEALAILQLRQQCQLQVTVLTPIELSEYRLEAALARKLERLSKPSAVSVRGLGCTREVVETTAERASGHASLAVPAHTIHPLIRYIGIIGVAVLTGVWLGSYMRP